MYRLLKLAIAILGSIQLLNAQSDTSLNIIDEVVISTSLTATSRSESPVSVDVYRTSFFKTNPSNSLFESVQLASGVRPQVNCNICNTGDIHINGMEGPYTMILIDGMPIISSLGTVYGLMGIPNSMIERMEIVKGPASTLYGSEAIGGLINVITKTPSKSNSFHSDIRIGSWFDANIDASFNKKINHNWASLTGVNLFSSPTKVDANNDGFTDVAIQHRASIFQKIAFQNSKGSKFNLGIRNFIEERWGGELGFHQSNAFAGISPFAGGDSVYGEAISTRRWEAISSFRPSTHSPFEFQGSFNEHVQNSYYGTLHFKAIQRVYFAQGIYRKSLRSHQFLAALNHRFTFYDDNTGATIFKDSLGNTVYSIPQKVPISGLLIQDQYTFKNHSFLGGFRYDYHPNHGNIFSYRAAWKIKQGSSIWRLNWGTGFRTVNVFTEDHAALTGSRTIKFAEKLSPEESQNLNISFETSQSILDKCLIRIESNAFFTTFNNRILPDYTTDPQSIIYNNNTEGSINHGLNLNIDIRNTQRLSGKLNFTYIHARQKIDNQWVRPILTENFNGSFTVSYRNRLNTLNIDYTGNFISPMTLPLHGYLDPRPSESPWWTIHNINFNVRMNKSQEIYFGVKNIFNWTPAINTPFLIARSNDPFNKQIVYDTQGNPIASPSNPYALTFDASYVYAPNQIRTFYIGIRY